MKSFIPKIERMSMVTIKTTLTKKFYYKNGQLMIEGKTKKNVYGKD
jgi:hypothetical protein